MPQLYLRINRVPVTRAAMRRHAISQNIITDWGKCNFVQQSRQDLSSNGVTRQHRQSARVVSDVLFGGAVSYLPNSPSCAIIHAVEKRAALAQSAEQFIRNE
jgi:hypothetical protein